jgi:septation ring formation regulator EzrA
MEDNANLEIAKIKAEIDFMANVLKSHIEAVNSINKILLNCLKSQIKRTKKKETSCIIK